MKINSGQKKIRLGIIGASNIAAKVLPSIRKVSEFEVTAVAAMRSGVAQRFADLNGIKKAYSNYEQCFSDPEIDAVYISALNSEHVALTRRALELGKHVLCEKPLAPTGTEAAALFALAESKDLVLLEGLMYRFHPQIQKLREVVASGKIGQIKSIHVQFSFQLYDLDGPSRPKRATGEAQGGALYDLGCYAIDFIHSMVPGVAGNPQLKVISRNTADPVPFNLAFSAMLSFPSGIQATIECAVDHPSLNTWEVCGAQGSVSALRFDPQGSASVPLYIVDQESQAELITCSSTDTFKSEFESFRDAVSKTAPAHISGAENIRNAQLLELIWTEISK